ncbi:hypothetical protein [Luteipulveratus halotolerans]|uniref:Scaffolding protein n=1 Tax=Luteipulveratus halotolerans TaxID=1631356 RepID=A0A0L6CKQ3_9MICO|nr:hypothetical protein [Luteipulveratus halotolerans]KNX38093.1 hypothetical protein VV01_14615 [Luteipulveratus halotolerans]
MHRTSKRTRNAAMGFGPLFNTDGEQGGGTPPAPKPSDTPAAKADEDEAKKQDDEPDYKDRFEAQRQVNRDLETKLNSMRDGFKAALGIEDKEKVSTDDLVSKLQTQLDSLTHTSVVNDVARRHKITDDDDLALLSDIKDQAAMEKLAARLAPSGDTQDSGKPRTPRPDPSQGQGSGSGTRATSVAQVMADRTARKAQ